MEQKSPHSNKHYTSYYQARIIAYQPTVTDSNDDITSVFWQSNSYVFTEKCNNEKLAISRLVVANEIFDLLSWFVRAGVIELASSNSSALRADYQVENVAVVAAVEQIKEWIYKTIHGDIMYGTPFKAMKSTLDETDTRYRYLINRFMLNYNTNNTATKDLFT
jgi:hypothetical protein